MNIKRRFKWRTKWNEYMSFVFKLDMYTCGGEREDEGTLYHFTKKQAKKRTFNNSFVFLGEWAFKKCFRKSPAREKSIIKVYHCLTQIFSLISLLTRSLQAKKNVCIVQKCVLSLYKISCSKRRIYATECVFHLMTTKKFLVLAT